MRFPQAPLKTLGAVRVSNVDKHTSDGHPAVRLCNYVDVYRNETVCDDMTFMAATATPDQIRAFRLLAGDTVFTKDSETPDDIGIPAYIATAGDDLVCGYHLAIFRPRPDKIAPRFAFWALKSRPVTARWETTATGVTRVGLKSSDIRKLPLPTPPLAEQRAIADYLDRETAKIDTLIEKQTTMIERLRERRVAVVVARVTRDRKVQTAAANDPLVKIFPTHWHLAPFGTLFHESVERKGRREVGEPLSVSEHHGVIPRRAMEGQVASEDLSSYRIVRPGQLAANVMWLDKSGLGVSGLLGYVSPAYKVFEINQRLDPRFVNMLMRSVLYRAAFQRLGRGVRPNAQMIDTNDLRALPVPVPPLTEQREIADYLDRETAKIDTLITKVERHIELAKERRAALITAAVTGQIDVTKDAA